MNLRSCFSKLPYPFLIIICSVLLFVGMFYLRLIGLIVGTVFTFLIIGNRRVATVLSQSQFWAVASSGTVISISTFYYCLITGHKLISRSSIDALFYQSLISTPLERLLQFLHGNNVLWDADFFSRRTHGSPTWLHLYEPLFTSTIISSIYMSFLVPTIVLLSGVNKFRNIDEKATVFTGVISLSVLTTVPTLMWLFDTLIIVPEGLGVGDISPFLLAPLFWGLYNGLILLISRILFEANLKKEPELEK
jgi:hypothetical protein